METRDRDRLEWEQNVARFERDGIVVTVSKLGLKIPRYSWAVGAIGKQNGDTMKFIPADFQAESRDNIIRKGLTVSDLITEAEDWIEADKATAIRILNEMRAGKTARDEERRRGRRERERERDRW